MSTLPHLNCPLPFVQTRSAGHSKLNNKIVALLPAYSFYKEGDALLSHILTNLLKANEKNLKAADKLEFPLASCAYNIYISMIQFLNMLSFLYPNFHGRKSI